MGSQGLDQVSPIKKQRTKVSRLPPWCAYIEPSEPQVQVFVDGEAAETDAARDEPASNDPISEEANQEDAGEQALPDAGEQVLPDAEEATEEDNIEAE